MKTHTYIRLFSAALAVSLVGGAILAQAGPAPKTRKAHHAVKHVTAELHARKTANKAQAPDKAQTQEQSAQSAPALPAGPAAAYAPPVVDQDSFRRIDKSVDLAKAGDEAAGRGDWPQATTSYQQALDLWPDNSTALYGLGKAADAAGDTAKAIGYYRRVIYTNDPNRHGTVVGDGFDTNDVVRLMEFALLLSKAGQEPEALAVYRRAAHLLNYQDADTNGGKPYLKVLLPEFGTDPNAAAYTPQRLQAMARVAISIEKGAHGSKDALPQAQEAVRLYPASPITYFYLGEQLSLMQKKEAKAAYQKAAALGDDQVVAAAHEELKVYH